MSGRGIYFASKTCHAPRWRALRASGVPTAATWIDEAGEGETGDYAELAQRCLGEISEALAVVLYCEPGETLKGALIEAGMALAAGVPVCCVGKCESLSRVFRRHPLWFEFPSIEVALTYLLPARPGIPG